MQYGELERQRITVGVIIRLLGPERISGRPAGELLHKRIHYWRPSSAR
jgi:hypothetical protein